MSMTWRELRDELEGMEDSFLDDIVTIDNQEDLEMSEEDKIGVDNTARYYLKVS